MPQIAITSTPLMTDQHKADQLVGGKRHLFACLDANRIANLPELLETGDAAHACLFQGDLAKTAVDLAPWLVQLTADDPLLTQLLTSEGPDKSNPFGFWEAEPGIFIHSDMSLKQLQRHLRRFLRVHTPDSQTFFFRFWEPAIAADYLTGLDQRPDLIDRWFRSREGGIISQIIVPQATQNTICKVVVSNIDFDAPAAKGAFALSNDDITRFGAVQMEKDVIQIAGRLVETFPKMAKDIPIDTFTRTSMSRMMQYGFGKKSTLFTLLAWEMHYGPNFETRDPEGMLQQLITAQTPPNEKFDHLKARMSDLGK